MEKKMKCAAAIMTAALLAVSVSGPADAGWKKFWKQVGDPECWKKIAKNDKYVQENCKV